MATGALETTKIGDNAVFAPDKFFDEVALESSGVSTSGEFLFAQTLGVTEIQIKAVGEVATGGGETLVVSVTTSATSGGSFAEVFSYTVPASTTIADRGIIAAYVAPADMADCYTIVTVTSDFDATGLDVDGVVTIV